MPSIIVYQNNTGLNPEEARQTGTILLGNTFNRFFKELLPNPANGPRYSPIQVLDETFRFVIGEPNTVVKHVFLNIEYELEYKGITTSGNKVKFRYVNPPIGANLPKSVKIQPNEDNFDPTEPTAFVMLAAFSNKRTDLLQDYLAETVDDILAVGGDLDDARAYTLAALTFSRCK